jgi:two-component system sensor histidine kinase YesM
MMAVIEGNMEVSKAIAALAKLFRYNIKQEKDIIDIREEVEHVKDYIFLQKIRYEDKFEVEYNIEESLLTSKTIKFTMQPIVENALYHGIEKMVGTGLLKINVYKKEDDVIIEVADNGVGMGEVDLERLRTNIGRYSGDTVKSIGLRNVNERAKLYFGEKYGLTIDSRQNEGTRVRLTIPAIPNDMEVPGNVVGFYCR